MHDARELLKLGDLAVAALARRGYELDLDALEKLLASRNSAIESADALRREAKQLAAQVQQSARAGEDTEQLKQRARSLKTQISETESLADEAEQQLRAWMLEIPNLPSAKIPDGGEEDCVEVRRVGERPELPFEPKDHVTLGENLGILDLERATKLSGPRFSITRGVGAKLERALANFLLDMHTMEHGYTEYSVPNMVTPEAMVGTGQLPKFAEDLFGTHTGSRDLYLIPTAEVPLTNLHAREILPEETLPYAYTAHTPCYRSEAGSYGRDTRGIIRLHQFSKVELVRFCTPESSGTELKKLLTHAETCLKRLGLAYRVVLLAAGDTGFASSMTYDIEVWLPGQQKYREISSCSNFETFQARRAGIRVRGEDGKKRYAATLNGSGLPIGRTLAAILEQYQRADGSVRVPDALQDYLGAEILTA